MTTATTTFANTPKPTSNGTANAASSGLPTTAGLDEIAKLSIQELDNLYRRGTLPHLPALDGTPRGRMLRLVGPLGKGSVGDGIRQLSAGRNFPWRGKSFKSTSATTGTGINRGILLGDLFPFDTLVGTSAIDGKPCVVLDYDKPQNPWLIRQIHDELRQVSPSTYIGPAMWKSGSDRKLVLYFAIDIT